MSLLRTNKGTNKYLALASNTLEIAMASAICTNHIFCHRHGFFKPMFRLKSIPQHFRNSRSYKNPNQMQKYKNQSDRFPEVNPDKPRNYSPNLLWKYFYQLDQIRKKGPELTGRQAKSLAQ